MWIIIVSILLPEINTGAFPTIPKYFFFRRVFRLIFTRNIGNSISFSYICP